MADGAPMMGANPHPHNHHVVDVIGGGYTRLMALRLGFDRVWAGLGEDGPVLELVGLVLVLIVLLAHSR